MSIETGKKDISLNRGMKDWMVMKVVERRNKLRKSPLDNNAFMSLLEYGGLQSCYDCLQNRYSS